MASDSFEIKAQKPVPAKPTLTLTAESCTAPTKVVISNYVAGQTYWNGTEQLTVDTISREITGLAVGTYTITAKNTDCESVSSDSFEIKAQKSVPAKPKLTLTAETCESPTKVVISNYVTGQTYWNGTEQLTVDTTSHEITGLAVGTYTITAKNTDCESVASDSFEIKAQKPVPAKPTLTLTAESCTAPTKVVISNYVAGQTYWNGTEQLTVDTISREITGLAVGTYTITAKNTDCESVSSDSFEIKAQKVATVITTNPVGATYIKDVTATALTITATGEGTLIYKWYKNTDNNYTRGTEVGENSTTYIPPTDTVGSLFYWVEVTSECGTVKSAIAEIKVIEPPITIEANDDPDTSVAKGGEVNILHNDRVNGIPATPTNVDITIPDEGRLTGVTINSATGKIKVPNNATPGTYEVTYQICVRGAMAPCDTAKVKITVTPDATPTINANDDPDTSVIKGGVVEVLTNDRVNGDPATPANVDITIVGDGNLTGVTADPTTGKIKVPNNALPGTYEVTYQICVRGIASPCDTAKVKIIVINDVTDTIEANDDPETRVARGSEVNILYNDRVNGNPATPTNVDITILADGGLTGVTTNLTTGKLRVPNDAIPGTYEITYQICVRGATVPCDTAKVKITITEDTTPTPTINANDDPETRVAKGGEVNILHNDRVNGNPATPTNVDITIPIEGGLTGVTINPTTGKIKVPNTATPGTYEVTYQICVRGAISPCDTAKVKITVTEDTAPTPTIVANDDPDTSVAKGGEVEVLNNDRLNGNPVSPTDVDITIPNNGGLTGLRADATTGKLKVPNTATPGTYEVTYQICVAGGTTTCDTAKVKIIVTGSTTPTIVANDDPDTSVAKGGEVNILHNDRVNGNPATPANVDITIPNNGGLTNLTVDPSTGKIKVPNDATPGTYEVTYQICVRGATEPCDTAKVKITVTGDTASTPTIDANDDPDTSVAKGGEVNILHNDRVNGNPATPTNVDITIPVDGGLTGVTINSSTGKIKVPNNATPGTYEVTYQICVRGATEPCDTAKVKITVTGDTASTPTIDANDDPDTSVTKGGTVDILPNDRLNGSPVAPTDVDITIPNNGGLTGLTVDSTTGKLKVPNTATPGTYEVTYKICDKAHSNICDTAKVKITVIPTIVANDDPDTSVAKGGEVEVLSNDRLEGNPIAPTDVDITIPNNGGLTGLTVDATTGRIKIPMDAIPGTYEVTYQICVAGGTTACDTAKVKITVNGRTIDAYDDGPWKVGTLGGLTPSILNNDILNGSPVSPSQVNIERTNGRPSLTDHFQRNEDGRISVLPQPQGLPRLTAGTYEYYYTIVDKTNSSNAASAKATIIVSDFVAADDVFEFGNPNNRTLTTESVLKNDQVGDKQNPSPTDDVNLTPGTASHPGLTMNADGTITIASGTPNGNYTYTYEICKKAAPSECERAIAYIKLHDSLEANDDDFSSTPVPSSHKTVVGNVLTNNVGGTDKLSGAPISDPTLVELTIVNEGGLTGVELSENGDISIPAGTPSGRYIVKYRISQVSDRNNYKEAVVTIVVSNEIPLVFHNGISVNGDGKNDGFVIEGIEYYPDNVLRIFNRWGVLVYEKERYGNRDPFVGISNGRATVSKDTKLPQGTYYYLLEYTDLKGNRQEKSGWLYLKTE